MNTTSKLLEWKEMKKSILWSRIQAAGQTVISLIAQEISEGHRKRLSIFEVRKICERKIFS